MCGSPARKEFSRAFHPGQRFTRLSWSRPKETEGRTIVVILADTGERYVTTGLFSSEK